VCVLAEAVEVDVPLVKGLVLLLLMLEQVDASVVNWPLCLAPGIALFRPAFLYCFLIIVQ
jgi:hypothetical protein